MKRKKRLNKIIKHQYENIGLESKGFGHPGMAFENLIFRQCRFSTLRMKDCLVTNCQITQCIIDEDSYLRHAVFKNVDFTGTIFRNCNLEKAKFIECNLRYVKFENCLLNVDNIMETSLPHESNHRLEIYRQLYVNELGQGRTDYANRLLYLVREGERDLSLDILQGKTDYFKNERNGKVTIYLVKYISSSIGKMLWGYGLNIRRICFTMLLWVTVFSILHFCFSFSNEQLLIVKCKNSILLSFNSLLIGGIDILDENYKKSLLIQVVILIQNLIGVVYFAVLTSAIYRKVAR